MARLEDALTGWGGGILIGLGAVLVAPVALQLAESIVRPVAKTVIWGGLAIVDGVAGVVAAGYEQVSGAVAKSYDEVSGLVAEARRELGSPARGRR